MRAGTYVLLCCTGRVARDGRDAGGGAVTELAAPDMCPELSYAQMDALAEQAGIGADKLLYLPYLMGERTPHLDADARGVFFGLSGAHTRAHLIRAVLEGVSYSLRDCQRIIEGMNGKIKDMTICGGGASSALWLRMLTDIFGCGVNTLHATEGVAFGAAILAGVGAGIYPSVEAACERLITVKQTLAPDAEAGGKIRRGICALQRALSNLKGVVQRRLRR